MFQFITDLFTSNLQPSVLCSRVVGVSTLGVKKHAWKLWSSSLAGVSTMGVGKHAWK